MKTIVMGLRLLVIVTLCANMTSLVAMERVKAVGGAVASAGKAVASKAYQMTNRALHAPINAARWVKEKCPCLTLENSFLATTAAGAVMATPGVVASCAGEMMAVNALTGVATAAISGTAAIAATANTAAVAATAGVAAVVPLTTALGACGATMTTASGAIIMTAPKLASAIATYLEGVAGYALLSGPLQMYIVAVAVWYVTKEIGRAHV